VAEEPAVHPCNADIHSLCYAMPTFQIAGPDGCRQAVLCVIGHADCFVLRAERSNMADRAEDLFLDAASRLAEPSIDWGLHVKTLIEFAAKVRDTAAGYRSRALLSRQL